MGLIDTGSQVGVYAGDGQAGEAEGGDELETQEGGRGKLESRHVTDNKDSDGMRGDGSEDKNCRQRRRLETYLCSDDRRTCAER